MLEAEAGDQFHLGREGGGCVCGLPIFTVLNSCSSSSHNSTGVSCTAPLVRVAKRPALPGLMGSPPSSPSVSALECRPNASVWVAPIWLVRAFVARYSPVRAVRGGRGS